MKLFTPELLRSFTVGFAFGCAALVMTLGGDSDPASALVPSAVAAPAH